MEVIDGYSSLHVIPAGNQRAFQEKIFFVYICDWLSFPSHMSRLQYMYGTSEASWHKTGRRPVWAWIIVLKHSKRAANIFFLSKKHMKEFGSQ